jgi:hypothetical protein
LYWNALKLYMIPLYGFHWGKPMARSRIATATHTTAKMPRMLGHSG